jgi:hypothetical protein
VIEQPIPFCKYTTLVFMFLLVVGVCFNTLVVLRCFSEIYIIQTNYKLDRESVASRQREIMTRLNSIEICVDAKTRQEMQ